MVGRAFLHRPSPRVALEQHEKAHIIQQRLRPQQRMRHAFQFVAERLPHAVFLFVHHPPRHKPLPVRRERAHPCLRAVAHNQELVVHKQIGDFLLIGLQLVERLLQIRRRIQRVFQLHHRQRQAVHKQNHIGDALAAFGRADFELVCRRKIVCLRIFKIRQPRHRVFRFPLRAVAHRHAMAQQRVKSAVARHQIPHIRLRNRAHHLVHRLRRQLGIEPRHGSGQQRQQHHPRHAAARKFALGGRQGFAVHATPAQRLELLQESVFNQFFIDFREHGDSFAFGA